MPRISFASSAVVILTAMVAVGWGVGQWRKSSRPTSSSPVADRGPMVYQVYCAACHGPDGHGDGSSAAGLKPPPRDFAGRPWRFDPTPETIRRVTLDGIPGTAMASFRAALPAGDLEAVVAHVHRLATQGPIVEKPRSEDEQILTDAGVINMLGTAPPPLTLSDAKGRTLRLSDFAGQLVMLHFWGSSCTHCIKEIPALNSLEREHSGRLKILHISTDEDGPEAAQTLLDRVAPGTTALAELSGLGLARYEVQSLPTVWLIGTDGTVIGRCHGAKDWTADAQRRLIARWLPTAR